MIYCVKLMWNLHSAKKTKKKSVVSNLSFLTWKTAIKRRLIDVFETLIDRFHETFVCIKLFWFFFNMHSNIYSCLFRAANIKEENITDSHAAWNEANVVTSLQIKERKTHLLFVSDLKIYRRMRLCVIIKKHKAYCDYWVACVKLRAMNGLENVKYYFQAFIP